MKFLKFPNFVVFCEKPKRVNYLETCKEVTWKKKAMNERMKKKDNKNVKRIV